MDMDGHSSQSVKWSQPVNLSGEGRVMTRTDKLREVPEAWLLGKLVQGKAVSYQPMDKYYDTLFTWIVE